VVFTASVNYKLTLGLLCAISCYGQGQWEFGGLFGYGWNREVRVNGPGGEAQVGIHSRFVAGLVVGEDLYEHIGGEVRYLYQDGDPVLEAGSQRVTIQGQSHTFVYDFLFHVRGPERRWRPYVAVGAGGRYYRNTGPAPAVQPLAQFATLVPQNEWKFVTDVGVGVKYRLHPHVLLRAAFHDMIAPFPHQVFVPAVGATGRGLFQQFTPTIGVSYWY